MKRENITCCEAWLSPSFLLGQLVVVGVSANIVILFRDCTWSRLVMLVITGGRKLPRLEETKVLYLFF